MTRSVWTIQYTNKVVSKDIPALDFTVKTHIQRAIESKLSSDPNRFGKPLRHSLYHLRSLRVGDYRVLYHVNPEQHMITIHKIGHRRDIYDD